MRDLVRSRIARNSVWNLLGLAIPLLVGIALVPVTLQGLGTARFGLLSLALTVLEYSTLFSLGLGPATTKHVASAIARNDESVSDLERYAESTLLQQRGWEISCDPRFP